jgi:hypothetical protein
MSKLTSGNGRHRSVVCNVALAAILLGGLGNAHAQTKPAPVAPPPVAPAPVAPPPVAPAPAAPPPVAPAPAAPPPVAPAPVAPAPVAPAPVAPAPAPAAPPPAAPPPAAPPAGGQVLVSEQYQPIQAPAPITGPRPPRESMKMGFSYSMGFATGDYKDFVGEASFRGFDFTALWPVYKALYIGPAFGYNLFYEERDRETYELSSSSAITAQLYRYSDYWTTSLVTRYFFLEPNAIARPYAGVRLGFAALLNTTLVADLSSQTGPTGFLLTPEAGVVLRMSDVISGSIAYLYNFSTADSSGFENLSYGALQFGLVLHWQDD